MIKRAFFYTTRKRGKTLILLLPLFVISTFVLTGLSILAAADQSALSLRQFVGGSIKLELDRDNRQNWTYQQGVGGTMVGYTGTPITDTDIEKVMSVKGIHSYNGVGDGSVFAIDFSFISGFSFGPGSDYSRLPSVSNSEYFNYFRRGAFKLVEGRHITPEDDHSVLISTALAERNGLKLGDTITVQCCYDAGGYAKWKPCLCCCPFWTPARQFSGSGFYSMRCTTIPMMRLDCYTAVPSMPSVIQSKLSEKKFQNFFLD